MAAEVAILRILIVEERILELEDLVASLKARLRTEKIQVEIMQSLAKRLLAAEKAEEVSMLEATILVSHTGLEKVERKLKVWNKELHENKVEALELRRENAEFKGTQRTRMVD